MACRNAPCQGLLARAVSSDGACHGKLPCVGRQPVITAGGTLRLLSIAAHRRMEEAEPWFSTSFNLQKHLLHHCREPMLTQCVPCSTQTSGNGGACLGSIHRSRMACSGLVPMCPLAASQLMTTRPLATLPRSTLHALCNCHLMCMLPTDKFLASLSGQHLCFRVLRQHQVLRQSQTIQSKRKRF